MLPPKEIHSLGRYHRIDFPASIGMDNRTELIPDRILMSWCDDTLFTLDAGDSPWTLSIALDSSMPIDAFELDLRMNPFVLRAQGPRAVRYALQTLNQAIERGDAGVRIPIAVIEDGPAIPIRGIVEGYYGTPWTFEERTAMLRFMQDHRLNTYLYAPKSDPYHRERWSDPYPLELQQEFRRLLKDAKKRHIEMYYTISPGYIKEGVYAFDYTNESDFERLFAKIDHMHDLGFHQFGLLLDDIDYALDDASKERFPGPGEAHAYICNRLAAHVRSYGADANFVMCPTEYHEIPDSPYRTALRKHLDTDIGVFFTGDNVCAESIRTNQLIAANKAFGHPIWIWDNFPVSDFTYGVREFIAPLRNRTRDMGDHVAAYLINPSNQYAISTIGMATMAEYAWDPHRYDPDTAFQRALKQWGEAFVLYQEAFVRFNAPNVMHHDPNPMHERWLNEEDHASILATYQELSQSAGKLLALDLAIIEELRPWLQRALAEAELAPRLLSAQATKDEILTFLEAKEFLGSELIDHLIRRSGRLTDEEFDQLITTRRGRPWYRIFESKRHE
jgi:hyaluronoglucosaminidase